MALQPHVFYWQMFYSPYVCTFLLRLCSSAATVAPSRRYVGSGGHESGTDDTLHMTSISWRLGSTFGMSNDRKRQRNTHGTTENWRAPARELVVTRFASHVLRLLVSRRCNWYGRWQRFRLRAVCCLWWNSTHGLLI